MLAVHDLKRLDGPRRVGSSLAKPARSQDPSPPRSRMVVASAHGAPFAAMVIWAPTIGGAHYFNVLAGYTTQVTGPTCDPNNKQLEMTIVAGGVKAAHRVKLVDASEIALPDRPEIGEVDASDWLPSQDTTAKTD